MPKRTQKKVSDGLSTPGRTGTERVLIKGQEKKSKLKDINRGQQRWRGGHVEGTERLDRRWIDERKVSFGVQYSIYRENKVFFFLRERVNWRVTTYSHVRSPLRVLVGGPQAIFRPRQKKQASGCTARVTRRRFGALLTLARRPARSS